MLIPKNKKIKNSGFSLIELLVALAVFTLIIGGVTLFSIRTIQAHTRSRAMQTAIENAQFAIEGLNKRIRTSSNIEFESGREWSGNNKKLYIKDNVKGDGYCYQIVDGDKLTVVKNAGGGSLSDCSSGGETLVGGNADIKVSGSFFVKDTDEDVDKERGLVTTVLTIGYEPNNTTDPYQKDSFTIQSTVSLRDYGMNP